MIDCLEEVVITGVALNPEIPNSLRVAMLGELYRASEPITYSTQQLMEREAVREFYRLGLVLASKVTTQQYILSEVGRIVLNRLVYADPLEHLTRWLKTLPIRDSLYAASPNNGARVLKFFRAIGLVTEVGTRRSQLAEEFFAGLVVPVLRRFSFSELTAELCYIDGQLDEGESVTGYFSFDPLSEVWGDDWDDAPYEHNAGIPYNQSITLAFNTSEYKTPADLAYSGNSAYSVEAINSGAVAWLADISGRFPAICAGITLHDFIWAIARAGGSFPVAETLDKEGCF